MFFVNFLGVDGYAAITGIFHHHHYTYFNYGDTIMPQFFFAVGFAYRLTFLPASENDGFWPACRRILRAVLDQRRACNR